MLNLSSINPPIQWVSIYSSSFSSVGRIHRLPITNNSSIIDIVGVILITFLKLWTKLSKENKETYQRQHFTSVESLRRKSPTYVLLTRFRYKLIVESATTTPKHMECVISFAERNLPHFFDLFQFYTAIHPYYEPHLVGPFSFTPHSSFDLGINLFAVDLIHFTENQSVNEIAVPNINNKEINLFDPSTSSIELISDRISINQQLNCPLSS